MLGQRPTLKLHWFNVSWLLGCKQTFVRGTTVTCTLIPPGQATGQAGQQPLVKSGIKPLP